jgi:2-phospho-L-lactate guanylyltransferase
VTDASGPDASADASADDPTDTDATTDVGSGATTATDRQPHVLVPFAARDPKTRLAPVLDGPERRAFARAMLGDVLDALDRVGVARTVLATAPVDAPAPVVVDDRPLTTAVNARLAGDLVGPEEPPVPTPETPVAVVMADLPLATPAAIERLLFAAAEGEGDGAGARSATPPAVTMAPGLGGGTNALCVRDSGFRVDYHGASCRDHRRLAAERGLDVRTVDSFRLATDVDEPADLVEVLLHAAETRAREWLRDAGFVVETGDGRVRAVRGQ